MHSSLSNVPDFDWNEANLAKLKSLWDEGRSARQIGNVLGTTRNAVLGKIHRLKLGKGRPPARPGKVTASAARLPRATQARRVPAAPRPRAPKPSVPEFDDGPVIARADAWLPLPGTTPVSLLDLGASQCKWPLGDPREPGFGFCGQDRAEGDGRYCSSHRRMSASAWQQAEAARG